MEAIVQLNQNNLQQAFAEAKSVVKSSPGDLEARGLLAQLFCFNGEWNRADTQFEILAQQNPEMQVGVSLVRQLIRAEQARQQFFQNGRMPEVVGDPDEHMTNMLKAMVDMRDGKFAESSSVLSSVRDYAATLKGRVNGKEFQGAGDLDDLCACYFEVVTTNGKYYFVPMDKVISIQFRGYERLQDRIWRSATIQVDGFTTEGEVYFPVNYAADPDVFANADDELKLGMKTDWYAGHEDGPVRGMGQKLFLFGDEQLSIMELESFACCAESD